MAGEGNADALVGVTGIAIGTCLAHNFGIASTSMTKDAPGGASAFGTPWMLAAAILCILIAQTVSAQKPAAS